MNEVKNMSRSRSSVIPMSLRLSSSKCIKNTHASASRSIHILRIRPPLQRRPNSRINHTQPLRLRLHRPNLIRGLPLPLQSPSPLPRQIPALTPLTPLQISAFTLPRRLPEQRLQLVPNVYAPLRLRVRVTRSWRLGLIHIAGAPPLANDVGGGVPGRKGGVRVVLDPAGVRSAVGMVRRGEGG